MEERQVVVTRYAIQVVPPEWDDTMPLPFDRATHDSGAVEQGTHVLVYRRGEGIIGEGEVKGYFVQPDMWTPQSKMHLPDSLARADYLLPLGMVYRREEAIPPEAVRAALDDPAFPLGSSWHPIDRDAYDRLNNAD